MGVDFVDPAEKAVNIRYHLTCEVHLQDVPMLELYSKGERQITDKMIFLVPRQTSECQKFLGIWLPPEVCQFGAGEKYERPQINIHFHELGAIIGYPVKHPARVAIFRRDKRFSKDHYLFMMSGAAEDALKTMMNERSRLKNLLIKPTIEVTILGSKETEEHLGE
jgi:hypothetical protein